MDPSDEPAFLLEPGAKLTNKYRLIEKIGQGGMGVVWSAKDEIAGRKVVLKFVPSELKNFESAVVQLKESFQKIHELHHQHICPVYTLEEEYSLGYYHTMKWLDGETLDNYIVRTVGRETPLPLEETLRILQPVASALDYAHGKRIVHRDIKPSNIFIELDGEKTLRDVQVIDFGLASEIRSSLTRVSQIRFDTSGTRPYMAPEQWRGRPQMGQTDQYAMAVLAYELLAGYLPFNCNDLETLRLAVLQDSPEPIRDLSDNTNAALSRALAKDAAERFESCTDFVEALGGAEIPAASKPALRPVSAKSSRTPAAAAPGVESLMKRGHLFLEDSDWNQADGYFDKVLDIDPEYAPAYVGKLCAELKVRNEESLGDFERPISKQKHFQKAVRFADEEHKAKIEGYDEKIRERLRQEEYDRLVRAKNSDLIEYQYPALVEQFRAMNGYKDTAELANECERQYHELIKQREKQEGIEQKRKQQEQYQRLCEKTKGTKTVADWQRLAKRFREMNGYKNTIELANQCENAAVKTRYQQLCEKVKSASTEGVYRELAEEFREMNGYKNTIELADQCENAAIRTHYQRLCDKIKTASTKEDYRLLAEGFRAMNGYANTAELANQCESQILELRYNQLHEKAVRASTKSDYQEIAEQFRAMNGYKNARELADDYDKRYYMLKDRREKQERIKRQYNIFMRSTVISLIIVSGAVIGSFCFGFIFHKCIGTEEGTIGCAFLGGIVCMLSGFVLLNGMIKKITIGCGGGFGGTMTIGTILMSFPLFPSLIAIIIGAVLGALIGGYIGVRRYNDSNVKLPWLILVPVFLLLIVVVILTMAQVFRTENTDVTPSQTIQGPISNESTLPSATQDLPHSESKATMPTDYGYGSDYGGGYDSEYRYDGP